MCGQAAPDSSPALLERGDAHPIIVLEGEVTCSKDTRERAIPYRFLVERTGRDSFQQSPYTPENLMATGNWNEDTQLNYGAFRSRFLLGTESAAAP